MALLLVQIFVKQNLDKVKIDFIHKMSISQKEINETIYWLELLCETNYLSNIQFESINEDAVELIKLITACIKTAKNNLSNN